MNTSHSVRAYIDTEFSNLVDMHLISIALVTDKGQEFYGELNDCPIDDCAEFTRDTVLPLLGRIPGSNLTREQLRDQLMTWLEDVRDGGKLVVSYDYFGDYALLIESLGSEPSWLRGDNVRNRIDATARAAYFARTGEPMHHALHDARALRCSYRPRTA